MIPVPHSDEELENGNQYLFPPPSNMVVGEDVPVENEDSDDETDDDRGHDQKLVEPHS